MLSVKGIYKEGKVSIEEEVIVPNEVKVIITFLEDVEEKVPGKLNLKDFSFSKSRELLKNYKDSLSESIIEERRREL
ncbi:MAG: hypothetical protein V1872_13775 [bacterium]